MVTTAMSGLYRSREASDSSASATKQWPLPWCAFVPALFNCPPMAKLGSIPAACMATTAMEVVEVFPCVPAISTWVEPVMSSPSRSERRMTGMFCSRAATSSGLSCGIAANEVTTTVGNCPLRIRFSALCPTATCAPMDCKASTGRDSFTSEPDTTFPRERRIRATPDMPAPPMPMRWTRDKSISDMAHTLPFE